MKDIPSLTNSNFSVGLIGPGAVGLFYASFLVKLGIDVTIITRSLDRYDGPMSIESFNNSMSFQPKNTLHLSDLPTNPFDVLIVATKVLESIDFVEMVRPFLGANTLLLLIQNGVFIEDVYLNAYDQPILRGLAFLCAVRESYSLVRHLDFGLLTYGLIQGNSNNPKLIAFQKLLKQSDMDVAFSSNIHLDIWEKLLWNAPFNPLSVVYGGVDTSFLLSSDVILDRIKHIMNEVCLASEVAGYPLSRDLIEKKIALTYKMDRYKTSMCLDYEKNLPLELNAILGNYISFCKNNGIDLPYSKELYDELIAN